MIKVIRLITRLNIGGPAIHTILLSSELNTNGSYKDILICGKASEYEGDMLYLARDKGITPIVIPELGREISFKNDIRAVWNIYSIIRRERPDIVHTHTAKAGTLGRVAAILAGVPVKIHTFHGHIFDGYFSPVKARIFVYIERFLALFTDKVISVSRRVEDDIVDRLRVARRERSAVIPLGLELDKFLVCENKRGMLRKKIGVAEGVLLIGIVGRLVAIKNHAMFLRAARIIVDKEPTMKVKFLVIGDGELKAALGKYARELGLGNSVIFTGWLEDLVAAYSDLDVVVLTSLNEGTPVSLIEGMASARPVVATAVGGVIDLVSDQETGLLVKSDDPHDLSDKVISLIRDSDARSRLGKNGRESVKEKYSKNRLVADIKNLYEECLKGK